MSANSSPFQHLNEKRYQANASKSAVSRDLMAEAEVVAKEIKGRIKLVIPNTHVYAVDIGPTNRNEIRSALTNACGMNANVIRGVTSEDLEAKRSPLVGFTLFEALELEYGGRLRLQLAHPKGLAMLEKTFGLSANAVFNARTVEQSMLPMITVGKCMFTLFGLAMVKDAQRFDLFLPLAKSLYRAVPLGRTVGSTQEWVVLTSRP